jgi:hypothetical protein
VPSHLCNPTEAKLEQFQQKVDSPRNCLSRFGKFAKTQICGRTFFKFLTHFVDGRSEEVVGFGEFLQTAAFSARARNILRRNIVKQKKSRQLQRKVGKFGQISKIIIFLLIITDNRSYIFVRNLEDLKKNLENRNPVN